MAKEKASNGTTKPSFTRLKPDTQVGIEKMAEYYRCTVSDLLRYAAEDLVSGKYLPAHLKPMEQE